MNSKKEQKKKGIKTILKSRGGSPVRIQSCYNQYLWVGEDHSIEPLIIDSREKLLKLRRACDSILKNKKKKS